MLSIRILVSSQVIKTLLFLTLSLHSLSSSAQLGAKKELFTHADTLRGTLGPGRNWWDVKMYDIHARFNFPDSSVNGFAKIIFKVTGKENKMQVDLQQPLILDSCFMKTLSGTRKIRNIFQDENAYLIQEVFELNLNEISELTVFYHGKPKVAKHAPWDGGLVWTKDKQGSPWMSIACQGLGASAWYPCKDHQSDEPDSASVWITCPDTLTAVSNGRLRSTTQNPDHTKTWCWHVSEPINNYCIVPYIGKYTHFSEKFYGEKGSLDMDYWVLQENYETAKKHFADAPRMMRAFEYWFGPFPFYKDGYKLVEAPYLGMEHQSAIAYGNNYLYGYHGRDLSNSGWGMKWDFIIVHESGHEWFANNITTKDIADMWVHEGFTNYSETLFTEYYYGKEAANAYCIGLRGLVQNDVPIIGPYGVNKEGSGDMYYKASNMIHTIRQVMNNDKKFRKILRGMNKTFWHQTITTQQIETFLNKKSGKNLTKVFDQYLRTTQIPTLKYKIENGELTYQWINCIEGFNMPVKVTLEKDKYTFISPTLTPQKIKLKLPDTKDFKIDGNFYIQIEKK